MIIDFKPANGGGGGGGGDMSNYYTKAQVNALVEDFITATTDDLVNYYLKSETYAKGEVDSLIGAVSGFSYEIAPSTASVVDPQSNVLYLIGPDQTVSGDQYEEYVYSNNEWVKIGDTSIDLAGYVTTSDLNTALANYVTSTSLANTLAGYASLETISTVAISGSYNDLEDKLVAGEGIVIGAGNVISATGATTTLATVATTGDYDDLINKPVIPVVPELSTVATTGSYNDLTDKPTIPVVPELSTVATTGSYNDLTDKPVIPVVPELSTVATTGDYDDLTNKPSIPDAVSGVNDGTNWTSLTIGTTTKAIPGGGDMSDYYTKSQTDALVANFITATTDDLVNYYLKSETYAKGEVDNLIGAVSGFSYEIAQSTSAVVDPQSNVLYLIGPSGSGSDQYEEYVYTNNTWTKIGDTSIDLSNYITVNQLNTALGFYTTTQQLNLLLQNKQDVLTAGAGITISSNVISADLPTLATVATTGSYNDLSDKPSIPVVPELATVATTGDYDDLTNKPVIPVIPTLATVATSGSYNDLNDKPSIPVVNDATITVQQDGETVGSFSLNQSGDQTIFLSGGGGGIAQQQADWAETDTTDVTYILNKPVLSTVATSGSYNDLTDKPVIPVVPQLATVATTGDYDDLTNKPSIPTVGAGTVTLTKGGSTIGTINVNDSANKTIDIPCSDLSSYYTKSETDALIANFITASTDDLVNYYLKSETYAKGEVDNLIGAISGFSYEIATSTASVVNPQSNVLYLIGPSGSGSDQYEEYVYANNTWTKIGDTSIDLSDYVTVTMLNTALASYTTTQQLENMLSVYVMASDLASVATSGSYNDLTDKPTVDVTASGNNTFTGYNTFTQTAAMNGGITTSRQESGDTRSYNTSVIGGEVYLNYGGDSSLDEYFVSIQPQVVSVMDDSGNMTEITSNGIQINGNNVVTDDQLATVATSGSYDDLTDKPTIPVVPQLAAVATSGSYNDLTDKPVIPVVPTLATVATSGSYNDLSDKLTAGNGVSISNQNVISADSNVVSLTQAQYDALGTNVDPDIIYVITDATAITLSTVATTGSYNDLTDKPSIPVVPTLATVATSGNYNDLTNKPDLTNYALHSDLAMVATTGSYNDLTDKPSMPTGDVTASGNNTLTGNNTFTGYNIFTVTAAMNGGITTSRQESGDTRSYYTEVMGGSVFLNYGGDSSLDEYFVSIEPQAVSVMDDSGNMTEITCNGIQINGNNVVTDDQLATVATSGSYDDLTDKPVIPVVPTLATVATTGAYSDLTGTPNLSTVATSGSYNDLTDKPVIPVVPTLATVATTGDYDDLTNKPVIPVIPTLATVATSGSYNDLTDKPVIPVVPTLATVATTGAYSDLTGTPTLTTVATSGDYNDLSNRPPLASVAISGSYNDLTDTPEMPHLSTVAITGAYSDLTGTPTLAAVATSGAYADLSGKPTLSTVATSGSYNDLDDKPVIPVVPTLATVATSGSYNDLTDKPVIPVVPTLATVATTGAYADLTGTPTLATVATSGAYADLSGKPTLSTVATSGSYSDLTNKPSIPTVNDSIITVRQGDTTIGTFSLNQSSNKTLTIPASVPEIDLATLSDLELAGFISDIWSVGIQAYMMSHRLYYGGYPITTFGEGYYDITGEHVVPTQTQTEATHCFWIAADNSANSVDVNHSLGYNQKLGRVAMFANEEGSHTFSEEYYEVKNVAYTGSYNDLDDKPSMGTAALVFTLDNNTTVTYNVWIQPSNNA